MNGDSNRIIRSGNLNIEMINGMFDFIQLKTECVSNRNTSCLFSAFSKYQVNDTYT